MTDYLADVVMPPPPEEPQPLTDEVIQEQMDIEEREELSYEVEEQTEEEEEELIPEPVKRRKIPQEEIFSAPKVKTILDPESMKEPEEPIIPQKKPKQTRKKRGPASAEQLERLARGREKAKETRLRKKIVEKDRIIEKGYSQADLDDAVARAVEQSVNRVEVLRKQRKELKKKAEAKAKHDQKVFHEINRALKKDVWSDCFI